jgi:hypothetical protein
VVPGDASGNPVAFTIVATGYTPGSLVSVEQCDGVATSAAHWSPTTDCDLGSSPSPALVDGTGKATFLSTDPNHAFTPFKGESPQTIFNCLSPNGPALSPSNGLTDYRNCKIRVSTSNTSITADQSFLNIQLPEAVAGTTTTTSTTASTTSTTSTTASTTTTTTPVATTSTSSSTTSTTVPQTGTPGGSCSGAQLLGKMTGSDPANAGLTDQSHRVTMSASLLTDLGTKAKIAGTCTGLVEPTDNAGGAIPAMLHPTAIALNLSGVASCASTASAIAADATKANGFALSGKLTITMSELDSLGKPFQVQAYVTVKGLDPAAADVLEMTGLVTKGASQGATVSGKLYRDAVSKISPAVKPPAGNGYQLDSTTASRCGDGTAGNASMLQAQLGDGTSLSGTTGVSGLSFAYAPASGPASGSCTGAQMLGKMTGTDPANPGLTDQSHRVTMSASLLTDLGTKAKTAGSCSGLVEPTDNAGGAIPATLHPKAIALKLSGIASCASTASAIAADATKANGFALSGKLTITMTELDSLGKPFQVQAYVTVGGYDPAKSDVLRISGQVVKGASVGATVNAKLYLDAVTKISPAVKPPAGNGYQVDSGTAGHCTDGTAGNASMLQAQLGDGSSLLGSAGVSGLAFGYAPAT